MKMPKSENLTFAQAIATKLRNDFASFVDATATSDALTNPVDEKLLRPATFHPGWGFGFHAYPEFFLQMVDQILAGGEKEDGTFTRDEIKEMLGSLLRAFMVHKDEVDDLAIPALTEIETGKKPKIILPGPGFDPGNDLNNR